MPVIKDKNSKVDCFSNYRPVSLVTMFSKVFEFCWRVRLEPLLTHNELQYGFVPNRGCQKALFTLETVVNYSANCGSCEYMAALDPH